MLRYSSENSLDPWLPTETPAKTWLLGVFAGRTYSLVENALPRITLRKHAYSNILKILPPKNENFQIKILLFFIFLPKT